MTEARFDVAEFDAKLEECGRELKRLVEYLKDTAQNSADAVVSRPYVPQTGWGITFYTNDRWFCQLHPKREKDHVQVLVRGSLPEALLAAGLAPADRADEQPWVPIRNMRDAVRLVPFIVSAANA
jgi:hypothetical protein